NLDAAERAVKFANDKLRGRASNRSEDLVHTLQQNLRAQYSSSPYVDDIVRGGMSDRHGLVQQTSLIHQQRWNAIDAARGKRNAKGQKLSAPDIWRDNIGNCFEHAVLACHYLKQTGTASYIAETDDNTDHVFVLIGSPAGLDGQTVNVTRLAPGAIAA